MIDKNNRINNAIQSYIKDMSFIIKKTHKIGVAAKILSRCLLPQDAYHKLLTELSSNLLSYSSTFHKKGHLDKEIIFDHIEEDMLLLQQVVFVLWSTGEVNNKSFSVVDKAVQEILDHLKENKMPYREDILSDSEGSEGRLLVDKEWISATAQTKKAENISSIKDMSFMDRLDLQKNVQKTQKTEHKRHVSSDKQERIIKIIDFIKDKKDVSIKDIQSVIEGVASKTIQRDIQELIEQGRVKKTGAKRWARYIYLR